MDQFKEQRGKLKTQKKNHTRQLHSGSKAWTLIDSTVTCPTVYMNHSFQKGWI